MDPIILANNMVIIYFQKAELSPYERRLYEESCKLLTNYLEASGLKLTELLNKPENLYGNDTGQGMY